MIDLETVVADYAPRPKRKYTVTERALAARLANLERANAVPREIRFRSTERRRRACHRNLTLALMAKKRDRSPRYATCFRNGWYVADPERALGLVGATLEEYHGHLEAWRREIQPRDASEEKLAHAIGMLSWRWIAGVRLECDLETLTIYRVLQELAAERRSSGEGSGGVLTAASGQNAADTGLLPVTAAHLTYLGYAVDYALGGAVRLGTPLQRISHRMLRLWQELLSGRGEPPIDITIVGVGSHRQPVALSHMIHSSYELADPFKSCSRIESTVSPDAREIAPVEQWASRGTEVESREARVESRQEVDSRQSTVDSQETALTADGDACRADEAEGAGAAFLHEVHQSDLAMLLEARRQGWQLPGSFEGFLRLVAAAIGGPGLAGVPPARWEHRVRLFARAVWKSLVALRRHADDLLEYLNRRLGDYAASLWPESWRKSFYQDMRSAHRMVGALAGGPLEGRTQTRREDLADFYHDLRIDLGWRTFRRFERCKAAVAVVCRE